jgi:RNA polymerase sigma-70 factor (ECF subfamily)
VTFDAAFQQQYRRHQPRLQRLAYAVLLDRDEAADVVQETFLKLHRHPLPDGVAAEPYLTRVALNSALSWRRRLLRFQRPAPVDTATARTPERELAAHQGLSTMRAAWTALPRLQRAAVALHVDQGLEPSAVAAALDITPNHARVTLHRALKAVRERLASAGVDASFELALPQGVVE